MVGELENFPPEAQQRITDAGGLESFLLESLRFTMMDDLIGLMKHAVSLTDNGLLPSHLNPAAQEFWPHADAVGPIDNTDEPVSSKPFPLLPDPYDFECPITDFAYLTADMDAAAGKHVGNTIATKEDKHTAVCVWVRCAARWECHPDQCRL